MRIVWSQWITDNGSDRSGAFLQQISPICFYNWFTFPQLNRVNIIGMKVISDYWPSLKRVKVEKYRILLWHFINCASMKGKSSGLW